MNLWETIGFFYVVISSLGFTAIMLYMMFCGARQWIDDARTWAAYRTGDAEFRKAELHVINKH